MNEETPVLFGIWIKQHGWVKKGQVPIVFERPADAQIYARWFRGKVYPIDESLQAMEQELIEAEKARSLWLILRNILIKLRSPKRNGS